MKKLSLARLAQTVAARRKALKLTQAQLAEKVSMNRSILSNLESGKHMPSIEQLERLAEALEFDLTELFCDVYPVSEHAEKSYRIAVAGTGYVGLSLAVLLAQHNEVTAVDIVPDKVEKLNRYQCRSVAGCAFGAAP